VTDPKTLVRQLVDEVINADDPDVLDDIATPALGRTLRRAFDEFRAAFPDWHQEIIELVAEGDTVVARFRCTGTHEGPWQGLRPAGRAMNIDEVYFFRIIDGRLARPPGTIAAEGVRSESVPGSGSGRGPGSPRGRPAARRRGTTAARR
jgi:predicted ester cyclase